MDLIRENERTLRDSIQRQNISEITAVDVFTAFYLLLKLRPDNIVDDRTFRYLIGVVRNVHQGREREFWYNSMFKYYEKLSGVDPNDSNWIMLQANLISETLSMLDV